MMQKNKRYGIINYEVISDPSLSLNSKAVYSVLAVHCNKNRTCFPSIGTVADMLNVSYSTIWRSMNELKKKNVLERKGKIIKLIK